MTEFPIAVVKRRQSNVQKSVLHVQTTVLLIKPIAFLDDLVALAIVVVKAPYSPVIRLRCVFLFLAELA